MPELSFEDWCKKRDAVLVKHVGLPSDCLPDLVFYHDHWKAGLTPEQGAAELALELATEYGENISKMWPELAEYL